MIRYAEIPGWLGPHSADQIEQQVRQIEALLPENYSVRGSLPDGSVLIAGEDNAGWTLDDYVLPRLASGLIFGYEVFDARDALREAVEESD